MNHEFCERCGEQIETMYGHFCEECLEEWAEENEVYL